MAIIRCYPFCEDILAKSISHIEDRTVLIYPTRSSANLARRMFQELWTLQLVDFITMDELKTRLLISDSTLLEEEKRLLCLYSVLNEEDRNHFHINEYADLVSWGTKWFSFFEELAEELIDPHKLLAAGTIPSFYLQIWQEEYIVRIMDLRERYRAYIHARGFEDKIFGLDTLSPNFPPNFTSYTFVNQYYYSALEKKLIAAMEAAGFTVMILFQGEEEQLDKERLSLKPLDLKSVFENGRINTKEVNIVETGSEEQMIISLLHRLESTVPGDKSCALIDRLFFHKPYASLFDAGEFGIRHNPEIASTALYQMLGLICKHLKEIISEDGRDYLPVRLIRDALTELWFTEYFDLCRQDLDNAKNELIGLIREDYLYLDTDLELFSLIKHPEHYQNLIGFLQRYFPLLKAFGSITCIKDLLSLIDSDAGISTARLASEIELQNSDFLDKFWERNNNFFAIEELGVVRDWQSIFAREPGSVAIAILDLYLQYIKSVRISYQLKPAKEQTCIISDLMDSRNQVYHTLILNNVIEGEIPQAPSPTWLLNETQRKCLSLKRWEDIRQWDRYYFYRLIFGAEQVLILCFTNRETNVEPGSFIGELDLACKEHKACFELIYIREKHSIKPLIQGQINSQNKAAHYDQDSLQSLSSLGKPEICGMDRHAQAEFFCLPPDPEHDFGDAKAIQTGYYGMSSFLSNAFAWYIEEHRKIAKVEIEKTESISRKVFGTILHNYISAVLKDYLARHKERLVVDPDFISDKYLQDTLFQLLQDPLYSYKIPKNYNREFLFGIMAECLVAAIAWVFQTVLFANPELTSTCARLIPEKEYSSREERFHKMLVAPEANAGEISYWIKGRADLRIETCHMRHIIDFKTGAMSPDQLVFYEWFYYLLDQKQDQDFEIKSMFCHLLDREVQKLIKPEESRDKLYERIREQLDLIATEGYRIALKSAGRGRLQDISRADLFKTRMWEES